MNHHLENKLDSSHDIDTLHSEWKGCLRCPLHVTRTQTVFGDGNITNPKIFIIGQSPGETEDKEGKPFVGRVSWHLNAAMKKAGISRANDCYITNSVICRPWIPHTGRNFPPSITSIESCRNRLLLEYKIVKNTVRVIVLVGKEAYATWMMSNSFSDPGFNVSRITLKNVLGWGKTPDSGIDTYTIYHPSYIARQHSAQLAMSWLNDWRAISTFINSNERISPRRQNG